MNVEPAIFITMVDVYELIRDKGIEVDDTRCARFDGQYRFETAHGHSHYVTGTLQVRAGDVAKMFGSLLISPPEQKPAR